MAIFDDFCVLYFSEQRLQRAAHFTPAFKIRTRDTSCVKVW